STSPCRGGNPSVARRIHPLSLPSLCRSSLLRLGFCHYEYRRTQLSVITHIDNSPSALGKDDVIIPTMHGMEDPECLDQSSECHAVTASIGSGTGGCVLSGMQASLSASIHCRYWLNARRPTGVSRYAVQGIRPLKNLWHLMYLASSSARA